MRFFYDCEFIEDGTTIELVSIGVAAEDGREFYAVSTEFDPSRAIDWVRRNVLDKLPSPADPAWRSRARIRDDLLAFLLETGEPIELWAWMAAYDHVVLAQLWGDMRALPRSIPRFTHELRQVWESHGSPPLPPQPPDQHDALADARHNLARWRVLTELGSLGFGQMSGRHRDGKLAMRIGVLTGGGDCPGLNAVIRAVVRKGVEVYGHDFVGFRDGWKGPLESSTMDLGVPEVRGILPRGGTILGSSRTNPLKVDGGAERVRNNLRELGVDALIAIGGEDTLGVATSLGHEGVNVVGVPKTIDNDLNATDYTFGFDTAVNIAMEAIDRLHTTAESHHRALIIEVMGRHAGWIALHAGLAGGANVILIPEIPFNIDRVCAYVESRYESHYAPIIVVAEGATPDGGQTATIDRGVDAFGHARLAESVSGSPVRSRPRPARRPAPRCSVTSSAEGRRPRSTGSWPRGSGCMRWTPCTTVTSARWSRYAAPTSSAFRWLMPPPS